ncbi:hypothetical protein CRT23_24870 [Methylobacterium sp. V23]|nr:hypothetical protein CRT23_24870 [Methylobacterium sp. V23]
MLWGLSHAERSSSLCQATIQIEALVGLRLLALSASWLREGLSITCAWTACEENQLFEACFELQVLN